MPTLKSRVEQLEEEEFRALIASLNTYFKGRTVADVEYFCAHGYLPDTSLRGEKWTASEVSLKERWSRWKRWQIPMQERSTTHKEFFCVHGHWPRPATIGHNGK